jgi:SAM-dependent methyltransferase
MDAQRSTRIKTTYDQLAAEYARNLAEELSHKPLDRQLLARFADEVKGRGPALEVGCGPGQVAAYLHALGADIRGLDLSPAMIEQARQLHPRIEFRTGDFFDLTDPASTYAGIVAFYAIVHIERPHLSRALRELRRVLRPGGPLLLAFHVGDEVLRPDSLWGVPVSLDWIFFTPDQVVAALRDAGFTRCEVIERDPYEGVEHASKRAYLFAY